MNKELLAIIRANPLIEFSFQYDEERHCLVVTCNRYVPLRAGMQSCIADYVLSSDIPGPLESELHDMCRKIYAAPVIEGAAK